MSWQVPTVDGIEEVKTIEGVVVHFRTVRAYWHEAYQGGNNPPDCYSNDCLQGIGDPGGECARCPFAQWGSDPRGGRGQACRQMMQVFILREGSILPTAITLPPTSLKAARQYFIRLAASVPPAPYWSIVTRFSLEQAKNDNGITYSRAVLSPGPRLDPDTAEAIRAYSQRIAPLLGAIVPEADEAFSAGGEGA
jgi:hypothetical protein